MLFWGAATGTEARLDKTRFGRRHTHISPHLLTRPDMVSKKPCISFRRPVLTIFDGGLIPPRRLDYFIGLWPTGGSDVGRGLCHPGLLVLVD